MSGIQPLPRPVVPPQTFADANQMVRTLRPDDPVICLRPRVLRETADLMTKHFPGRVLYAVKCNHDTSFMKPLHEAGVVDFDTASIGEIRLVRELFGPDVGAFFMHPVKARSAIYEAYYTHGVRTFVLDHPEELTKIRQETGGATDTLLVVRLATARGAAVYDLGGKFGATVDEAASLLQEIDRLGHKSGIAFHVGSQCMEPEAYARALDLTDEVLRKAGGVKPAVIDVGGGFPVAYMGLDPVSFIEYSKVIKAKFDSFAWSQGAELWCEPGRGMVASGASLVTRVKMRRGNSLYLNDGMYGGLSDLRFEGLTPAMRCLRLDQDPVRGWAPFRFYGPTCDSCDVMEGPFFLPEDIGEGDWIEIGQAGAYTMSLRTEFNGFKSNRMVMVKEGIWEDAATSPDQVKAAAIPTHAAE
ncbi:MAG: type III PLP-dependent enzyme [Pseudomonadota bacterium]